MMVKSLFELSLCASLKDLNILKQFSKYLNQRVLYELTKKCFSEPKKTLAFTILLKNWPFDYFSMRAIDIMLKEEDLILIASLIQKGEVGFIRYFDLLYEKFGVFDCRATDAFLKISLSNESLLSTKRYGNVGMISRSYNEALNLAHRISCLQQENRNEINATADSVEIHSKINASVIRMELVANCDNFSQIMELCKWQEKDTPPVVRITIMRLQFDYLATSKIAKILDVVDKAELIGVDLSYNCLSNSTGTRLMLVCEQLQKCQNIENICLAYNNIESKQCYLLTNCLKHLTKLKHLDLSFNQLGVVEGNLVDLFLIGFSSCHLKTLILSGCALKKSAIDALVASDKVNGLQKLKMDQNFNLHIRQSTLKKLLLKLENTLQYVDISSCGFQKNDIINLCPVLNRLVNLQCLVIWPNPGITAETLRLEILPMLMGLSRLEMVPPIGNAKQVI